MKHIHYSEVELEQPSEEGIKDVKVRWLISKKDRAENFAMRMFEIQPGGHTPLHQHDWEHEVFVLEGVGKTRDKDNENAFKQGDILFIPAMEWHQFVNTSDELIRILCLIPYNK